MRGLRLCGRRARDDGRTADSLGRRRGLRQWAACASKLLFRVYVSDSERQKARLLDGRRWTTRRRGKLEKGPRRPGVSDPVPGEVTKTSTGRPEGNPCRWLDYGRDWTLGCSTQGAGRSRHHESLVRRVLPVAADGVAARPVQARGKQGGPRPQGPAGAATGQRPLWPTVWN